MADEEKKVDLADLSLYKILDRTGEIKYKLKVDGKT